MVESKQRKKIGKPLKWAFAGISFVLFVAAIPWYMLRTAPYRAMQLMGIKQENEDNYIRLLRASYLCGNAESAYALAEIYREQMKDGTRNADEYREILEFAASKEHIEAINRLAIMRYKGSSPGNIHDEKESVELWHRAAHLGSPSAKIFLALCYRDGVGVKRDKAKAKSLLERCKNDSFVGSDARYLLNTIDSAWEKYSPQSINAYGAVSFEQNYSPTYFGVTFPAWGPMAYHYGTHKAEFIRSERNIGSE